MRFLTRSLTGLLLLSLTLGLLLLAGNVLFRAIQARNGDDMRREAPAEREFAVNVAVFTAQTAVPVITAYGEVASWRTLELRAATSGRVVDMADTFRDGERVTEGQFLIRVDPADAQSSLDLAGNDLTEAGAELAEARKALELAVAEVDASTAQRDLRAQALLRQKDLLDRGAGTSAAVETAALALSGAEQTLVSRRQALAVAEARIERAVIARTRREIGLAEAQRTLADTELAAPFTGLLSEVNVVRGRLLSANEKIGTLIDPEALELAFRVSNAQFARLIDENARLRPVQVRATLSLDDIPITVIGTVDRAGAEVGAGQTGRMIFARLDSGGIAALRPGDFMVVEIEEPPLADVAVIPATAATNDGRVLLIGPEDRLEEVQISILRRQGDSLIVSGAPFGREYATERLPQIGPGIKVRPVRPGDGMEEAKVIRLDPERRARLIAAVEANTRMPAEIRDGILRRLQADEVPFETVERIEARMAGVPPAGNDLPSDSVDSGETVELDAERRARLIAYVQSNDRIPTEAKARILTQLGEAQVPREMIERLESRMGG